MSKLECLFGYHTIDPEPCSACKKLADCNDENEYADFNVMPYHHCIHCGKRVMIIHGEYIPSIHEQICESMNKIYEKHV